MNRIRRRKAALVRNRTPAFWSAPALGRTPESGGKSKIRPLLHGFSVLLVAFVCESVGGGDTSRVRPLNNLVSQLIEVSTISTPVESFQFSRANDGWVFIVLKSKGEGTVRVFL